MLDKLRNFSKGKLAAVLVAIIIVPFVFWGMGSSLSGRNKNIVVQIDKTKYYHFGHFQTNGLRLRLEIPIKEKYY